MKCLMFMLICGSTAFSQTIVAEAPSVSASALTVPQSAFQVEMALKFDREFESNSDDKLYRYSMPYSLLRYGVTRKIEVRTTVNVNRLSDNGSTLPQYLFNEIGVGAKFQILDRGDTLPKIAIITHFNLYNQEHPFKGASVNLAFSNSFGPNHSIGLNAGITQDLYAQPNLVITNTTLNASLIYAVKLSEKISVFGEYFTSLANSTTKNFAIITSQIPFRDKSGVDFGIQFFPMENIQFDYNFGINHRTKSSVYSGDHVFYKLYHSLGFNILLNN